MSYLQSQTLVMGLLIGSLIVAVVASLLLFRPSTRVPARISAAVSIFLALVIAAASLFVLGAKEEIHQLGGLVISRVETASTSVPADRSRDPTPGELVLDALQHHSPPPKVLRAPAIKVHRALSPAEKLRRTIEEREKRIYTLEEEFEKLAKDVRTRGEKIQPESNAHKLKTEIAKEGKQLEQEMVLRVTFLEWEIKLMRWFIGSIMIALLLVLVGAFIPRR